MDSGFKRVEIPHDLEALSDHDLLDLKVEVDALVRKVRSDLTAARRRFASGGKPASPEWMRRCETLIGLNGTVSQKIQRILSRRKDKTREWGRNWFHLFAKVAKARLDPAVYKTLVDETHQLIKSDPLAEKTPLPHNPISPEET